MTTTDAEREFARQLFGRPAPAEDTPETDDADHGQAKFAEFVRNLFTADD